VVTLAVSLEVEEVCDEEEVEEPDSVVDEAPPAPPELDCDWVKLAVDSVGIGKPPKTVVSVEVWVASMEKLE
jgi:hypothetical protein